MSSELRVGDAGLLPHQYDVVADRVSKIRVVQGGYRSGKTVTGVAGVVDMGFRSEGASILVMAPTYRMIADVFVATAQRMLDLWELPHHWHKSDKILSVGGPDFPFLVLCRSADKPRSTEGLTVGGALVDEWELCERQALITAFARVSIGPCQQILLTGTAESFGPAYDLVLANPAPTTRVWRVGTAENTYLAADYVATLRANLSDDEAAEKIDGVRRHKVGTVYNAFVRAIHAAGQPSVTPGKGEVQVWADFNRVGKMAWVVAEVDKDRRCAHVVGEVIGNNTDTGRQAEEMLRYLAAYFTRTRGRAVTSEAVRNFKVPVFCDASGIQEHRGAAASHVALLRQAGFRPKHNTKNPLVADRVNTVNVMLRDRRLTFDPDSASFAVQCIERQVYDGDAPDKVNGLDHANDAIGYGLVWQFPLTRKPLPPDAP